MNSIPTTCRSFWIEAPQLGQIRAAELPECGPKEVLVQALHSGVSRGTEALVYSGKVPGSVASAMRAPHQEGDFSFPIKYGYASVGRVLLGPAQLTQREVFCLYPHQDYYVVAADDVVLLPGGVPAARAVLGANMETALNGVWDAELKAGDRVSIVGAGVVGCLAAFLAARHPGTEVELVDVDPTRASVAQAFGAKFSLPEEARTGADVVLHTSGVPQGLETALRLAGAEARVVELSWYGTESVSLPLGERFHPARLRIVGSQVGALPLSQRARWNHRRRLEKALELCKAPELDVLLHSESSLTDLPVAMAELVLRGGLCHRVNY